MFPRTNASLRKVRFGRHLYPVCAHCGIALVWARIYYEFQGKSAQVHPACRVEFERWLIDQRRSADLVPVTISPKQGRAAAARQPHKLKVAGSSPAPATHVAVAQMVEQRAFNPQVAGSIPASHTRRCSSAAEQVALNDLVGGSSPSAVTIPGVS